MKLNEPCCLYGFVECPLAIGRWRPADRSSGEPKLRTISAVGMEQLHRPRVSDTVSYTLFGCPPEAELIGHANDIVGKDYIWQRDSFNVKGGRTGPIGLFRTI